MDAFGHISSILLLKNMSITLKISVMPSICISVSMIKLWLTGDFNTNESHVAMKNFLELFNLTNLVKEYPWFKSIDNPSCIDLFITNCTRSFLYTSAITTGISDVHKMGVYVS